MIIEELGYILQERDFTKTRGRELFFMFQFWACSKSSSSRTAIVLPATEIEAFASQVTIFLLHRDIIIKIKEMLNYKILLWSYDWRKLSLSQRRSAVARAASLQDPVLQALESAASVSWIFCFAFFWNLSFSCVHCVYELNHQSFYLGYLDHFFHLWSLIIASIYGNFRKIISVTLSTCGGTVTENNT